MPVRRTVSCVLLVALGFLCGACAANGPTPRAALTPAAKAAPYPSTAHGDGAAARDSNSVDRLLLDARDLGRGYGQADASPTALPCTPDAPPVDRQVQHTAKAVVAYVNDVAGVRIGEQLYLYPNVALARTHQKIVTAGLACLPAPARTTLTARTDWVRSWTLDTAQASTVFVVARLDDVVVQFAFVTAADAPTGPDVTDVVDAALAKVAAAS